MKIINILFALTIISLTSCSKDSVNPNIKQSHIKGDIDGKPFAVYRDSIELITDVDYISFSVGSVITTYDETQTVLDSCFTIDASYNGRHLKVKFPYSEAKLENTIPILRESVHTARCSGSAHNEPVALTSDGQENLLYSTLYHSQIKKTPQKIGQIKIIKFDEKNKTIEGTFYFKAYGYYHDKDYIVQTDQMIEVSNGEFYVEWDNLFQPTENMNK